MVNMRFLDKNNNQFTVDLTEAATKKQLEEKLLHDYHNPDECLKIPETGNFVWDEADARGYSEKPADIEALKAQAFSYLSSLIQAKRSEKFIIPVTKADGKQINVLTDLTQDTLNEWIIVKNKIGEIKKAPVVNADTGLDEFIPLTDAEILRLNIFLTNSEDVLKETTIKLSNKIKKADDELVLQVAAMTPAEQADFVEQLILECTPKTIIIGE
jgi:hypothetical protein